MRPLEIRTIITREANRRGITLTELSEVTGISYRHLQGVASGKRRISQANAARISAALGVGLEQIVTRE